MTTSFFESISKLPEDPILSLTTAFQQDIRADKINLGVGAYKDVEGRPTVLNSIRDAEKLLIELGPDKEYLPIDGDKEFVDLIIKLIFGEDSPIIKRDSIYGMQTVGCTSALRIGGEFLSLQSGRVIYVPNPSWPIHKMIFSKSGLKVDTYPYYDENQHCVNFDGICKAITKMPAGSAILLQACCNNPVGTDPTPEQWQEMSHLIKEYGIIPFFDFSYQGFGEDFEKDAYPVRLFAEQGHEMFIGYSCSKNFGLYGERVGMLAIITEDKEIASRASSHLKQLVRTMYSNPPSHGIRLVKTILNHPKLRQEWMHELNNMRERITGMRTALVAGLQAKGNKFDFSFMNKQKGMFSLCGLNQDQVMQLKQENGIYMPMNGRINVAGLNPNNLHAVIEAISNILS